MSKKPFYKQGATVKEKKRFAHYLSEEEELILVTGFSRYYTRNRFAFFMLFPGGVFWILGAVFAYYYNFNIGIGLLLGYLLSMFTALIQTIWMVHAHRYLLTTRRVMIKSGFFNIKITSALFDKITHIQVSQGFLDRIVMHHGTIILHTAGMIKGELKIEHIEEPLEFKNLMERLINKERSHKTQLNDPLFTVEGELVN